MGALLPGWKKVSVAEVAKVVTGKTPLTAKKEYYGGSVPFVAPGDLGTTKYIMDSEKSLSLEGARYAPTVPVGSTLFTCIGSTIGKIGLARKELRTNQQINSAIPNGIDSEYLYYALAYLSKRIKKLAAIQAVPIVNKTEFENQIIIIPEDRKSQKAIADILRTWDTAIEKTEALVAAKEKQFDILTRNHISVRQSSSSWQPNTIGNIFDIKTYSSKSSLIKDEGTYYIVDMGSISRKGNLIKTKKTDTLVDPLNENDLVMPKDDIGGGNIIGKVAIIEKNGAFSCGDHVYRLVLKSNSCDPYFLKYLINCPAINRRLRAKANGTSQLGLGKKDLVKQLIRLPSLQEQREIAELLNTAKREIDTLKTLADRYRTQKRGLMQKLLTGKLRVKI